VRLCARREIEEIIDAFEKCDTPENANTMAEIYIILLDCLRIELRDLWFQLIQGKSGQNPVIIE